MKASGLGRDLASEEDFLDLVEHFEAKLRVGRGSRRNRCAGSVALVDLRKGGPMGLKRELRSTGRHTEAYQLLRQQVERLERKERKALLCHERGRRESHRCFRGSKNAADVGELWPYK
ncbi:hypothetical protein VOLCADRAFT_120747 [Volvox carteri f. nagariensis]|uniref:Uncharacterized protein n=1 Tax=Volvox carteri f. nagariensis TaxID=3068 RepID=D8TRS1_VOLCA|nr:uncharacterized protein VOLCADRAFT_120747 [Volvox carteri f. nagariensis]EFJ49818.1 hypothetical protein VOLCADRAFT_120747 [Volvox carteri f. nagariensis]|eukprot:XP_002949325.1 hypothetical protein VOLCADRAFT_120747 [Volvox carteri f. nagariensis]